MRTVGHRTIPQPHALPSASALRAAAVHQATGAALAAVPTTGVRKGIYRYASHEEHNQASDEALAHAIAINAVKAGMGGAGP